MTGTPPPLRASTVHAAGDWSAEAADTVVLDFEDRHRRRIAMVGTAGLRFLLDLPEAVMLRSGDALELEDGRLVEVLAAPEPLVEVRGREATDLVRLAWHVGNRHVPAQVLPRAIRLRRDHVIEAMLEQLGATLRAIEAPFDPEGGAYAAAAAKAHDHAGDAHGGHDHAGHDHGHEHGHGGHDHGAHQHDNHRHGHPHHGHHEP